MITFKPCVTYRRKDGTYAVRIRVTFARKVRYLSTTLTAHPEQLTRSGKLRDGALIASADALVRQMREAVAELNPFALEGRDVDWVVAWLRQKMRGTDFRLDYFAFAEDFLAGKKGGTAACYRTALNAFARHLGRRELDINDITRPMVQGFIREAEGIRTDRSEGANARHAGRLAAIFRAARDIYNDGDEVKIPRTPFDGIDLRTPPAQGQKPLDIATIQRIISARPDDPRQAVALAAFVVSFGLMGANFADMWQAGKVSGSVWRYERAKTRDRRQDKARVEVDIDRRLAYHLSVLMGPGRWWLPALHTKSDYSEDARDVNRHLRRWQLSEELPAFTFYAARHSFATIARGLGIEKATVDECLAHIGDFRIADIYAERNWERINEANRKVLDLFNWEGSAS